MQDGKFPAALRGCFEAIWDKDIFILGVDRLTAVLRGTYGC